MEYFPKELAYTVWEELDTYSWNELYYLLKNQQGIFSQLSKNQQNVLMQESNYFSVVGQQFPQSEEEFYELINQYAHEYTSSVI